MVLLDEAAAGVAQLAVERHARQMRADHGDRNFTVHGQSRRLCQRRLRDFERAERQAGRVVKFSPDGRQRGILAGRRKEGQAERRAVFTHARRYGEAAQIEQVDEIGIGAEPAVELNRDP